MPFRRSCGLLLLAAATLPLRADDWPQWGGRLDRNFASLEKGIPALFTPGDVQEGAGEIDRATTKNVRWTARLGTQTYGNPTVAAGRVFVGTNSAAIADPALRRSRGGAVLCFDERTGQRLWELHIPRFKPDPAVHGFFNNNLKQFNFDDLNLGVCSSPTVEGKYVYLVGNRGELLCLDVNGQADGNDGPFTDEAAFMAGPGNPPVKLEKHHGDIVWFIDMITHPDIRVWVQDAADCSVIILGDILYVCPSNGVDRSHRNIPAPDAPMLLAIDKKTGKILARDDVFLGKNFFHGAWSSPSAGVVNGKTQVFFGGPDGWCYAFDPTPVPVPGKEIGLLKTVWKFDCNPPHRRLRDGKPMAYRSTRPKDRYGDGPSEIIATPVFHKNRVYVCVGQDPRHGKGVGNLACIDPTKTGDISQTGAIWQYDALDRSLSTVSILDNLLFVADYTGKLHCLDPDTGKPYWVYDTGDARIWSSTFAVDGKVFLGTEKEELHVLAVSKEKKLLGKIKLGDKSYTTPIVANGVLYVTSQSQLWAITEGGK